MYNFFYIFICTGFLEKNRDSFSQDLKQLVQSCTNELLKNIFDHDLKQDTSGKRMVTLSSQFRTSLDVLMKTLGSCHPFFVRCIKPNENKQPQVRSKNEYSSNIQRCKK